MTYLYRTMPIGWCKIAQCSTWFGYIWPRSNTSFGICLCVSKWWRRPQFQGLYIFAYLLFVNSFRFGILRLISFSQINQSTLARTFMFGVCFIFLFLVRGSSGSREDGRSFGMVMVGKYRTYEIEVNSTCSFIAKILHTIDDDWWWWWCI